MFKRNHHLIFSNLVLLLLIFTFINIIAFADEGMWTFDNPPIEQLKEYGFTPTHEWLDHVRLASVRFMDGGSGSFVSPNGLVITNHHVAVGQLQKISTEKNNYVNTGFFTSKMTDEHKCPDLEVNVLISMDDVTQRVRSAMQKDMNKVEALKARKAEIAKIEKESLDETGLRSNVISLYHGGEYWLYRYKKYTDVRLVFAPERQAAYYGGDFDNFTYPRYDLDVAFFRVYENDKPINSEHYFKWNSKGAAENELVFVPGNPGSTDRLYTYSRLEFQRDFNYPLILKYIDKRLQILHEYMKKGPEQERRALVQIFSLENSKKALTGELNGLLDEDLMAKRKNDEENFRKLIAENPEWEKEYGAAWDIIDKTIEKKVTIAKERFYRRLFGSKMAGFAQTIVRYVTEVRKPDGERLDGYHDSELPQLKFRLFSPAPIYRDLEEALLAGALQMSLDELTPDDEFIKIVLGNRTPEEVAKELISGTQLDDVDLRKKLLEGGENAVKASSDPLIVLARNLDPMMRASEKWYRENIESVLTPASEKIAKARFAVYGKDTYPDATFTLRLAYGTVKGYPMNGTIAPYKTTLYGLFDRSLSFDQKGDFSLPQRFWDRQKKLDLSTPVNFVSTCDIIGGNSGSPVINKKAEIVGLIFDGNIESLPGRFIYDETKNRAVAVHSAYITEALNNLYKCKNLAKELEGK
ncbi:MAG: S46 family peptidase [Candidatus Marinimicrobia bacterium]|nr:S46 family peptidase [Candidatus Neomarinimicrobiota bacterium]